MDSDKPGGKLPPELRQMRRRQRWTCLPLRVLGWLCLPIGGWRIIALFTLHRNAGWYYCGNVGDANHHATAGPYPTKHDAWREGRGHICSAYHDRLFVFHSWDAPPDSFDPRSTEHVGPFWFLLAA